MLEARQHAAERTLFIACLLTGISAAVIHCRGTNKGQSSHWPSKDRVMRRAVYVFLFFLIIVQLIGVECVAPVSHVSGGRLRIAVLNFGNGTGNPDLSHWQYAVRGLVHSQLAEVKSVRVLPPSAVDYGFRKLKIEAGEAIGIPQARKIGELIETRRVVWGSYRREGEAWRVRARVLNVASGEASAEFIAVSTNWFDVRDKLTNQILLELGILPSDEERKKMSRRSTTSATAFEWYSKSYALHADGEAISEQEQCERNAIAEDPRFAKAYVALAASLGSQGNFVEAEQAARHALKIEPDSAQAHLILGLSLLRRNEDAEGELELWKSHALDPEDAQSLSRLGQLFALQGKRDQAIAFFEMARQLDPTDASIHAALALAYARKAERHKAMVELREAERLAPEGTEAVNAEQMICQAYEVLGDIPSALEHYDRFIMLAREQGLNPEMVAEIETRAQHLKASLTTRFVTVSMPKLYTPDTLQQALRERLTDEELGLIVNPLAISPEMQRWARELTEGAERDFDKARAIFDGVMRRIGAGGKGGTRTATEVFASWNDPEESFSCQEYAKLYVALARDVGLKAFYVHAEKDYTGKAVHHDCAALFVDGKALLVDPAYRWFGVPHEDFTILDDLQAIAHHLSQPSGTASQVLRYRVAMKLHPDFAWGQSALVGALINANQWVKARREQEVAMKLQPDRWETHYHQGVFTCNDGDFGAAVGHLRRAIELNPESSEAHFCLALALTELGEFQEAREEYRACLRYNAEEKKAEIARRAIAAINEKIAEGKQ